MLSRRLEKHAVARSEVVALLASMLGCPQQEPPRAQRAPVPVAGPLPRIVRAH